MVRLVEAFRVGMSGTGLAVLGCALVVCAVASWWLRTRDGAARPASGGEEVDEVTGALTALGVDPSGAELTVVQFSTAFCGPCRATRARLQQLAARRPGLQYLHVDAESHLDAVRELDVRRTPTLFWLDRTGALLARSSGAPRPAELTAFVEARTGGGS